MRSGVGVGPVENSLGDARKSDEFRLALGSGHVGPKDQQDRYYRGNAGSQMKSSAGKFHGSPLRSSSLIAAPAYQGVQRCARTIYRWGCDRSWQYVLGPCETRLALALLESARLVPPLHILHTLDRLAPLIGISRND